MSICWKFKASGRILEKVDNPIIPGSADYYPKTCSDCQGTGYVGKKKLPDKNKDLLSDIF